MPHCLSKTRGVCIGCFHLWVGWPRVQFLGILFCLVQWHFNMARLHRNQTWRPSLTWSEFADENSPWSLDGWKALAQMETKMGKEMCGQWSKEGLDVGDSQDGNKGGCRRHMRCMHQVFPLVSELVQGAIPQHLVLFGPVVLQQLLTKNAQQSSAVCHSPGWAHCGPISQIAFAKSSSVLCFASSNFPLSKWLNEKLSGTSPNTVIWPVAFKTRLRASHWDTVISHCDSTTRRFGISVLMQIVSWEVGLTFAIKSVKTVTVQAMNVVSQRKSLVTIETWKICMLNSAVFLCNKTGTLPTEMLLCIVMNACVFWTLSHSTFSISLCFHRCCMGRIRLLAAFFSGTKASTREWQTHKGDGPPINQHQNDDCSMSWAACITLVHTFDWQNDFLTSFACHCRQWWVAKFQSKFFKWRSSICSHSNFQMCNSHSTSKIPISACWQSWNTASIAEQLQLPFCEMHICACCAGIMSFATLQIEQVSNQTN